MRAKKRKDFGRIAKPIIIIIFCFSQEYRQRYGGAKKGMAIHDDVYDVDFQYHNKHSIYTRIKTKLNEKEGVATQNPF